MIDFRQDPAVDCKPTARGTQCRRGGGDGNKMTDRIGCHTQSLSKVISKTISLGKITEPARGWLAVLLPPAAQSVAEPQRLM